MACKLLSQIVMEMQSIGITNSAAILEAYNKNNQRPFEEAKIYPEILKQLQKEEDPDAKNNALLYTFISLTPDFRQNKEESEITLKNIRNYRNAQLEKAEQKQKLEEAKVNQTEIYSASLQSSTRDVDPLILTELVGLELFQTLNALSLSARSLSNVKLHFEELAKSLEERESLTIEDAQSLAYIKKVVEKFPEVVKWYEGIKREQNELNVFSLFKEESEEEEVSQEEMETRKGENWAKESVHVAELAGAPLRGIVASLPILENVPTLENKRFVFKKQFRKGKIFMSNLASSNDISNYNTISSIVGEARTYSEAYDRLAAQAKHHPQIETLLQVLPAKEYEEKDIPLVGDFMNVFGLPEVAPYVLNISRVVSTEGDLLSARMYKKLSNSTRQLIENYDRNFLNSAYRKNYISSDGRGIDLLKLATPAQYSMMNKLYMYTKAPDLKKFLRNNYLAYDTLMDYIYALGIDEMVQFKSGEEYYDEGLEYFSNIDNFNALISLMAKVQKHIDFLMAGIAKPVEIKIERPMNFLYNESFAHPQGEVKKSELEKITNLINQTHPEKYSPSYLNAANKLKNAINQKFHLTQVLEKLNQASDLAELMSNNPEYDFTQNPDILGSQWLSKGFVKAEGKNIVFFPTSAADIATAMKAQNLSFSNKDHILQFARQFKRTSTFKVISISGIERKIPTQATIATVTPDLTPGGKIIQDLASFFDSKFIENPRFGEKTSSYGIEIERPNWAKREEHRYYIPFNLTKNNKEELDRSALHQIFSGYIKSEMRSIYHNIVNSKPEGVFGDKCTTLFLGDMFEEPPAWLTKLQAEVNSLAKEYQNRELSEAQKQEVMLKMGPLTMEYISGFMNSFDNFLSEEVKILKLLLAEETGSDDATIEFFNAHKITKEKIKVTPENLDYILGFFIKNAMVHNIEFFKIFVGSLANFNKTFANFREVFKRIVNMSSPGKIPMVDQNIKSIYARSQNATKFSTLHNGNGSGRRWGRLHTLVYNDVDTFFGAKEEVWKAYKEAYDLPNTSEYQAYINGPKEADAQAVSTIEFYRNYLNATGSWESSQDATYDLEFKIAEDLKRYLEEKAKTNPSPAILQELKDSMRDTREQIAEKIRLGEAAPFPPLKLGHYGRSLDDPQQSVYHKMSIFPLLPSTVSSKIEEEDFEDISRMMQTMFAKDIDYYVFKSGSKQANPKRLLNFYNEDGTVNTDFTVNNATVLDVQNLRELQYQAPKFKKESVLTTQGFKLLFSDLFDNGQFLGEEEFKGFVQDQIKLLEESTNSIIQANLISFDQKLGIVRGPAEAGRIGEIQSYDEKKLAEFLASKHDETEEIRKYVRVKDGRIVYNLLGFRNINKVNLAILNEITNKIISIKLNGDSLIQAAQTPLLGRRKTTFTKEDFQKNGAVGLSNGLKFYRVENGVVMPMEIMVAWHPDKHAPLLELEYMGQKLKEYPAPIETINKILEESTTEDAEWVKTHMKQFMYAGVRIPVQGHNSMESMKVKKFLPSSQGPAIILPPQIVTKSGSDYDIDKMTVYYPNLDKNGEVVVPKISLEEYKKNLSEMERIKTSLGFSEETLWNLRQYTKGKEEYADVYEKLNETYFKVKKRSIRAKYYPVESLGTEVSEIKQDIAMEIAKAEFLLNQLEPLSSFSEGMENNIISVFHSMLSRKELYNTLIRPNDSPILKEKAEKIKSRKLRALDVFSPVTSYRIFKENILARKALGIDAKINTAHKMFQQVGISLNEQFAQGYKFLANRDEANRINLGKITFADSEQKISNIVNEFINGHVDAGNEDFLLRLGMNDVITPIAHTMLLMGTNKDFVFSFLSEKEVLRGFMQTIKNDLFNRRGIPLSRQLSTQMNVAVRSINEKVEKGEELDNLDNIILQAQFEFGDVENTRSLEDIVSELVANSPIDLFTSLDSNFKLNKIFEGNKFKNEIVKFFTLHQMNVIAKTQGYIRQLTSITDFNTARHDNTLKLFLMQADINELRRVFTNIDALYSRDSSLPLAKFNLISPTLRVFQQIIPGTHNEPVIQSALRSIRRYRIPKGKERQTFIETYINNVVNAFQALHNADSRRGRHASYFFASESGQFVKIKGQSQIETRFKNFLKVYPQYLDNEFIKNIAWRDEEFNGIKYTIPKNARIKLGENMNAQIQEAMIDLIYHEDIKVRNLINDLLLGAHYASISKSSPTNLQIPPQVYSMYSSDAANTFNIYLADPKGKDILRGYLDYISALTYAGDDIFSPAVFMANDVATRKSSDLLEAEGFYSLFYDRKASEEENAETINRAKARTNQALQTMLTKAVGVQPAIVPIAPTPPSAPQAQPPVDTKVLEGDIFSLPGIPIITTNLGGVHGAGLAQAAKAKGLVTQGEGSFKATDDVVQLPVKKKWSDDMSMNNNMELLKESLRSLIKVSKQNTNKTYLLPLAGLGHGEGSIEDILPLLIKTVQSSSNIKLVIPSEEVNLGRQGTVKKDYTRENLPKIKNMLSEAGLFTMQPTVQPVGEITVEQIYSQLGTQTKTPNIVISNIKTKDGKYDRDANIKEAEASGRIYSMETDSDLSFSNPWAHFNRKGTIKTETTKEAVKNYIDWLTTDKFKDVKPKRREWILNQLKSGELKGKAIQYYAELKEPSHATALDYLINKYDWTKDVSSSQLIEGEPIGVKVKDGIYVNQGALTEQEQLEIFDYLKPYIAQQAAKTNKGAKASKMVGLGLRWDYKSNNPGKEAVNIPDVINPANKTKYGYYTTSINNQPLAEIPSRLRELLQKATGVDLTDYDSAIINLYDSYSFISSHNDVDESRSAINYPVIGINIGGQGNFSIESRDGNPLQLKLDPGSAYIFGLNGKNREVFHRTFDTPQSSFLPELTTEIDGMTYPAGSYRITITLRRAMPLTEGMPSSPKISSVVAPKIPIQEAVPQKQLQVTYEKIISNEDIALFNAYVRKGKGVLPKQFFTAKTLFVEFYNKDVGKRTMPHSYTWALQNREKGLYAMIDVETGEVIGSERFGLLQNVNLSTGMIEIYTDPNFPTLNSDDICTGD